MDIVAIGLEDGLIIIHNLKYDETLLKFIQDWGPVLQITFRTDGPPHMATSSDKGNVAIWDLEKGSLKCQKREIHRDGVFGCQYIHNEPLLVTSSSDNSIKIFVFDDTDGVGRQLYAREGHSKPPTFIRFYGSEDNQILSIAPDVTFRCFSLWSERLHRSFGHASFNKKYAKKVGAASDPNLMPPMIEFASGEFRQPPSIYLSILIFIQRPFERMSGITLLQGTKTSAWLQRGRQKEEKWDLINCFTKDLRGRLA